jgi:hypothetical protein
MKKLTDRLFSFVAYNVKSLMSDLYGKEEKKKSFSSDKIISNKSNLVTVDRRYLWFAEIFAVVGFALIGSVLLGIM